MVLADSHRVSRVPWYLGVVSRKPSCFRLRGCYPLWLSFPEHSTNRMVFYFPTSVRRSPSRSHDTGYATLARLTRNRFRLFPVRSPLLRESLLFSLPGGTEMVHFPPFAPPFLCIQKGVTEHYSCRVSPFGNPRLSLQQQTEAYRSLQRPSSPSSAKASTMCP
jgi:hypothetical protein